MICIVEQTFSKQTELDFDVVSKRINNVVDKKLSEDKILDRIPNLENKISRILFIFIVHNKPHDKKK